MAADVTIKGNVIKVYNDTVEARLEVTKARCSIQKIVWTGVTTVAHKATITDFDGDVIADFVADAPGTSGLLMYALDFPAKEGLPVKGLCVTDLDSGTLFIYLNPVG